MARFQYRLQKVFELRERKKKEQEEAVVRATARVRAVEAEIEAKKNEIRLMKQNMMTAHHTLMGAHDDYIHVCFQALDELFIKLKSAQDDLKWEQELLKKAHSDLEALIKHKEKSIEEWKEEEKRIEMKQLDEIAGQRYFRAQLAKNEDEMQDDALKLEQDLLEQDLEEEALRQAEEHTI